jgi:hypothetical protein
MRRDLIFRVFVSSKFGDLIDERNDLQERMIPHLYVYCQQRRACFRAIDLRWGVGQEVAIHQQTMNVAIS